MKVYILEEGVEYESSHIVAVYTTELAAMTAAKTCADQAYKENADRADSILNEPGRPFFSLRSREEMAMSLKEEVDMRVAGYAVRDKYWTVSEEEVLE